MFIKYFVKHLVFEGAGFFSIIFKDHGKVYQNVCFNELRDYNHPEFKNHIL